MKKNAWAKGLSVALATSLLAVLLAACAPREKTAQISEPPNMATAEAAAESLVAEQEEQPETTQEEQTRIFVDSAGREVEIPVNIERVAPSGSVAQTVLYTINPDQLIGWADPSKVMKDFIDEKYWSLPTFGQFYGKNVSLNMEALIAAKPDVIIDIGEAKETIKEDMDGIQEQTGIPVLFVEAVLDTMPQAYTMLGEIMGRQEQCAKLAEVVENTLIEAREKAQAIPDDQRVRVYYGTGEKAITAFAKGVVHADILDIVGAINVVEMEKPTSGGSQVSMEQIIEWNPQVIIVSPGGAYDNVLNSAEWQDIEAVKNKAVYEVPLGPFDWAGSPPSVNRVLGIKWIGDLLYPDASDSDHYMIEEAQDFYRLFYHLDITEEQAKDLMKNSTYAEQALKGG